MTLSHLQPTLLSAYAKRYNLCSSVRSSFTAACRDLRPAALSLEIIVSFCPGQPVAALSFLALKKGFLSALATNAASWAGLDPRYNPLPLCLPTCPSIRYFRIHSLEVDFGTPYSCPAALTDKPLFSTRGTVRSRVDLSQWAIMMGLKRIALTSNTSADTANNSIYTFMAVTLKRVLDLPPPKG
jgi:hypothetical protein